MTFKHALLVDSQNKNQIKIKKQNKDTKHFENAIYWVLNERSSITASFADYLKFQQEKKNLAEAFWVNCGKSE